jgi:hypothetical protein
VVGVADLREARAWIARWAGVRSPWSSAEDLREIADNYTKVSMPLFALGAGARELRVADAQVCERGVPRDTLLVAIFSNAKDERAFETDAAHVERIPQRHALEQPRRIRATSPLARCIARCAEWLTENGSVTIAAYDGALCYPLAVAALVQEALGGELAAHTYFEKVRNVCRGFDAHAGATDAAWAQIALALSGRQVRARPPLAQGDVPLAFQPQLERTADAEMGGCLTSASHHPKAIYEAAIWFAPDSLQLSPLPPPEGSPDDFAFFELPRELACSAPSPPPLPGRDLFPDIPGEFLWDNDPFLEDVLGLLPLPLDDELEAKLGQVCY